MSFLVNQLSRLSTSGDDYTNILILGETGVGKSTFINAFANYLTYGELEQAENSNEDLVCLIPTSFNVTDDRYQVKRIFFGKDDNEAANPGTSQTQSCRAYLFPTEDRKIRLIDTPGIGDTRGVDQDRKNFDNILAFVSHYEVLHGIMILLKPNNSRLTITFRFCIQELLCHLHRSAKENILFVFTNARGTFYRPGDTLTPLKSLLDEIKDRDSELEIPLDYETIYCLDNEGFRFLIALQNGIVFNNKDKENFSVSWERSAVECERMLDYITRLKPHEVKDTISVNEARRLIVGLSRPIGDITQNIQVNLVVLDEQREKIKAAGDDIDDLKKHLYVPVVDLEPVYFNQPRTVCAAPECVKTYTVQGISKIDYIQRCHDPCYLTGVQAELINNPALIHCAAMGGSQTCNVCRCGYEKHMHIYYENKQIMKELKDTNIEAEIDDKEKRKDAVQKVIDDLEAKSKVYLKEQQIITKVSAKFAHFLKVNAISPYNDAIKDYLEHLIQGEKTKAKKGVDKTDVLDKLQNMLNAYEVEVRILKDSLNSTGVETVTADKIADCVQELYDLEINGSVIKKMMDGFDSAQKREYQNFHEHTYTPQKKK